MGDEPWLEKDRLQLLDSFPPARPECEEGGEESSGDEAWLPADALTGAKTLTFEEHRDGLARHAQRLVTAFAKRYTRLLREAKKAAAAKAAQDAPPQQGPLLLASQSPRKPNAGDPSLRKLYQPPAARVPPVRRAPAEDSPAAPIPPPKPCLKPSRGRGSQQPQQQQQLLLQRQQPAAAAAEAAPPAADGRGGDPAPPGAARTAATTAEATCDDGTSGASEEKERRKGSALPPDALCPVEAIDGCDTPREREAAAAAPPSRGPSPSVPPLPPGVDVLAASRISDLPIDDDDTQAEASGTPVPTPPPAAAEASRSSDASEASSFDSEETSTDSDTEDEAPSKRELQLLAIEELNDELEDGHAELEEALNSPGASKVPTSIRDAAEEALQAVREALQREHFDRVSARKAPKEKSTANRQTPAPHSSSQLAPEVVRAFSPAVMQQLTSLAFRVKQRTEEQRELQKRREEIYVEEALQHIHAIDSKLMEELDEKSKQLLVVNLLPSLVLGEVERREQQYERAARRARQLFITEASQHDWMFPDFEEEDPLVGGVKIAPRDGFACEEIYVEEALQHIHAIDSKLMEELDEKSKQLLAVNLLPSLVLGEVERREQQYERAARRARQLFITEASQHDWMFPDFEEEDPLVGGVKIEAWQEAKAEMQAAGCYENLDIVERQRVLKEDELKAYRAAIAFNSESLDHMRRDVAGAEERLRGVQNQHLELIVEEYRVQDQRDARVKRSKVATQCEIRPRHLAREIRQNAVDQKEAAVRRELGNLKTCLANVEAFTSAIECDLTCKVCMDIIREATILWPCGHSFCKPCIGVQVALEEAFLCPECHHLVSEMPITNRVLDVVTSWWVSTASDAIADMKNAVYSMEDKLKWVPAAD
ncbi:zinc finger protein [Diplonema papillatum]|nr:zinc finger protein [Diplonema papillatum]